jgi:hypothetical protein
MGAHSRDAVWGDLNLRENASWWTWIRWTDRPRLGFPQPYGAVVAGGGQQLVLIDPYGAHSAHPTGMARRVYLRIAA